jgi:hypothetical protein
VTDSLGDTGPSIRYLLRDRDDKFGPSFDAAWQGVCASILRSPVPAPNTDAVAEHWVRTTRSERTDRLLIVNEGHLRRVLYRYICHYNEHRPNRRLALRPARPPTQSIPSKPGTITSTRRQEVLGALINEYPAA